MDNNFNTKIEFNNTTALKKIFNKFPEIEQKSIGKKYIDLREYDMEKVESFLSELESNGNFVFHGNPTKEILQEISPREVRDNETEENSMKAVFASPRFLEALAYGFKDTFHLKKNWQSYTLSIGHESNKGVSIKMNSNLYNDFKNNKKEYLQNTFLYILNKKDFKHVPNRENNEFYSNDPVTPFLALYIPKEITENNINFEPYNNEEEIKTGEAIKRTF